MRKWLYAITIIAAIGMVACKQGSSSNNNNGTLNTNGVFTNNLGTNCLNSNVLNNGFCNNNVNFSNNNTFTRYPVNNGVYQGYHRGYSNGFAGCGYHALAVYHPSVGLACIPVSILQTLRERIYQERRQYLNVAYWNWNSTSYNFSFHGWNSNYGNIGHMGTLGLCNGSDYSYGISGTCHTFGDGGWGIWANYSYEEYYEETTYYGGDSYYGNNGY